MILTGWHDMLSDMDYFFDTKLIVKTISGKVVASIERRRPGKRYEFYSIFSAFGGNTDTLEKAKRYATTELLRRGHVILTDKQRNLI